MEMQVQAPPSALSGQVAAIWTLQGRVAGWYAGLPKPYAELIISLSGRHVWRAGPESAPLHFDHGWLTPIQTGPRLAATDGLLSLVGARLDPLACARLFGVDCMREPRLPIPLDALVGHEAHMLRARLLEAPDSAARRALLGAWLVARLTPATGWLPSERELHRDRWRVDALAHRLGLSPRGLHKRFTAELGLGPKLWLQLTRFDALLRHAPDAASLADAAYDFGFADQSHMTTEFRRFAGAPPLLYAAARSDTAAPSAAPHFLPGPR